MEEFSIIICSWLFALVAALFIWMIFIQSNVSKLTEAVKDIKSILIKSGKITTSDNEDSKSETDDYPAHIDEISDSIFFSGPNDFSEDIKPETTEILPEPIPSAELSIEKEEKTASDFEKIFLGNIFNKIGAFAILIGIIIFIKLISPFIIFTPAIKAALGYLVGFAMIGGALKLHANKKLQNYSEVLLGTGFGALFITTYCASTILALFSLHTTFAVATALLLASFYLADKLKTISMLAISLVAGYLNPFFIHHSPNFLFGYLVFVNLLSIAYTYKNRTRNTVNIINLVLTCITALIFVRNLTLVDLSILFAIYFAYDILTSYKNNEVSNKALNYTNFIVFSIMLIVIFPDNYNAVGYTELGIFALYAITAAIKKSNTDAFKNYIYLALSALNLFVYFLCQKSPTTKCLAWSAEAAILSFYAYKFKFNSLANWAVAVWTAAFLSIIPVDGVFGIKSIGNYTPVWNIRLGMFAPVILSSAVSHFFLRNSDEKKVQNIAEFFRLDCISLSYLYIGLESNSIINKWFVAENTSARFINSMINIILGFAYTINFEKLYKSTEFKTFRVFAFLIGIYSAIYLIFAGIHYIPLAAFIPLINLRAAAFCAAIIAAGLLAKWNGKEFFKYLAVFFGFLFIHYEINDVITKFSLTDAEYLISVCWVLYSGAITSIGIFKNKQFLKLSGIWLCILSILRIFLYDLAQVDILYKFIAFLTLGVILLALSYIYNKRRK